MPLSLSHLIILQSRGTNGGYYIGSREFELPELKLLVDAVQASKFISRKKSQELIGKLESLCSENDAKQLQRNVFIYNRAKTGNETVYYNVDQIHTAILSDRQISFHYGEWTVQKTLKLKKNGELYKASPWALTWDNQNYYLIAYDESADFIKHYRVDKMLRIQMTDKAREGKEHFRKLDMADYAKKSFGMFGGEEKTVKLLVDRQLAGVIVDRFGKDVHMIPVDEKHFTVSVTVMVSSQFLGWIFSLGEKVEILGPEEVKEQMRREGKRLLKQYS